eukprot:scaffold7011_cov112-Isochrysis_galbana.AAC.24
MGRRRCHLLVKSWELHAGGLLGRSASEEHSEHVVNRRAADRAAQAARGEGVRARGARAQVAASVEDGVGVLGRAHDASSQACRDGGGARVPRHRHPGIRLCALWGRRLRGEGGRHLMVKSALEREEEVESSAGRVLQLAQGRAPRRHAGRRGVIAPSVSKNGLCRCWALRAVGRPPH